jgi:DNA repair ATPase RecN
MGPSFTIVPNSQVIISRVAYQNNSSKYFINNKASNATEVTTYLRKRGIDLDNNRFLILQGEVEQISLMKPKVGEGECMYRRERRRTTRVCWSTWRTSLEQPSTFR